MYFQADVPPLAAAGGLAPRYQIDPPDSSVVGRFGGGLLCLSLMRSSWARVYSVGFVLYEAFGGQLMNSAR